MTRIRGTSNKNLTGSAANRRARKQWLLVTFGDGRSCRCYRCGCELTAATLTVDRILAGMDGGTYVRSNIRPACEPCNIYTGNKLRDHRRRFPLGVPVRFAGRSTHWVAWEIVAGESEDVLLLRSTRSGMHRTATRDLLEPLTEWSAAA